MEPNRNALFQTHLICMTIYGLIWELIKDNVCLFTLLPDAIWTLDLTSCGNVCWNYFLKGDTT